MKIWNSIKSFIREHDSAPNRRETERLTRVAAEPPPEPTEREFRALCLMDNPWLECLAIINQSITESKAQEAQWERERVSQWETRFAAAPPEMRDLMMFQETQRRENRRHKELLEATESAAAAGRAETRRLEDQLLRDRIALYFH